MRFVCISDTHNQHQALDLPEGEFLLHAGDFSGKGKEKEVREFLDWFSAQSHPHKVLIAGNHDFMAEREPEAFQALLPDNIHYLNDSGVELEGIHIWGSPIQPWFFDWAFNRQRGPESARHWALIPETTDVLITHGPPYGILDRTVRGKPVGCEALTERLPAIRPAIHLFGHIHEAYGEVRQDGTHYINASVLDVKYRQVNDPIVVEWE